MESVTLHNKASIAIKLTHQPTFKHSHSSLYNTSSAGSWNVEAKVAFAGGASSCCAAGNDICVVERCVDQNNEVLTIMHRPSPFHPVALFFHDEVLRSLDYLHGMLKAPFISSIRT